MWGTDSIIKRNQRMLSRTILFTIIFITNCKALQIVYQVQLFITINNPYLQHTYVGKNKSTQHKKNL